MIEKHIEALIFCSQKPIDNQEIQRCLTEMMGGINIDISEIEKNIKTLITKYQQDEYSFELLKSGGGFQFLTKPAYQTSIKILLKQESKKRLSNSALETLSIIVFKQPITKNEVEKIRGVNCDYAVQKLLEKELVEIKGKSDTIGKPMLYGTTKKFLDYFGINDLSDLPTPKEFERENKDFEKIGEIITQEDQEDLN